MVIRRKESQRENMMMKKNDEDDDDELELNDDELELLLGEIPHEISLNSGNIQHYHHQSRYRSNVRDHHNHHHHHHHNSYFRTPKNNAMMYGGGGRGTYNHGTSTPTHHVYADKHTCASPVSGFSLKSDGSSSSLFSRVNSFSDSGSPTAPLPEELKTRLISGNSKGRNRLGMESKGYDESVGRKVSDNVINEINLARSLNKLQIGEQLVDRLCNTNHNLISDFDPHFSGYGTYQFNSPAATGGFDGDMRSGNVRQQNLYCQGSNMFGSPYLYSVNQGGDDVFSHLKRFPSNHYHRGMPLPNVFDPMAETHASGVRYNAQLNEMNMSAESDAFGMYDVPQMMPRMFGNSSETAVPNCHQQLMSNRHVGIHYDGLEGVRGEDSMIFNAKNNHSEREMIATHHQEKRFPENFGNQENVGNLRMCSPLAPFVKGALLGERQEYIYSIAKDQQGCRFLQRVFDEGTPEDLQNVFNGIIDHVVELMMNPFGNYLIQKLLEVCTEEQRMQILLKVATKPGKLIRISLNAHGTRVVQKLIETLNSRQQISLLVSALEPGFLDLINDLNGNHVIQRCLQCLTNEDSKFIVVAATKYCVEIATHPHGCCVLQRCISHSTGELRENLIAKIISNGLVLAQDAFGNYVVQFILELKIPSATNKLVSQFNGNYINLSAQKFSSHVVEKCLHVCNKEIQSKIIHELLSATPFEHLLQDPHANYVVQTALKISEGHIRDSLVEKIESHKAMSRNSPYSKRIFTHKLLKK